MKKNFEDDFKKYSKDAHGIYFWESEYLKRKFLMENKGKINDLKNNIANVLGYLCEVVKRQRPDKINDCLFLGVKIMQVEFYRRLIGDYCSEYKDPETGFNIRTLLMGVEFPDDINDKLLEMNSYSYNYHYFVDDLVSPTDMNELASDVLSDGCSLPDSPKLFHHKDATVEIDQNVFRWGFSYPHTNKVDATLNGKNFFCDYIAMVDFLNPKFNYSEVVNCFRRQLAYLIYIHKGYGRLKEDEKTDLLYTFKSDAGKGYGSEFAHFRAVALLIWDYKFKHNDLKGNREFFQVICGTEYERFFDVKKLKPGSYDYKKLIKWIRNAEKCIECGKVLSI